MRKKLFYMDLEAVEIGRNLCKLERLAHERLLTTRDWDNLFFWMDLTFSLRILNDYEKFCFVANLIHGYTKEEIALKLNVSRQAVMKQVSKATKKIKNFLKDGYETPRNCTL